MIVGDSREEVSHGSHLMEVSGKETEAFNLCCNMPAGREGGRDGGREGGREPVN